MMDNLQWIVTAASILAAVLLFYSHFSKLVLFMDRQKKQDDEIKEIKEELVIVTFGLLACLKGLKEQGCNGPVTEGINELEKHMNKQAHK